MSKGINSSVHGGGGGARCVALVGPYLSGKTTLLEGLLVAAGAIPRKGSVRDGSTIGDGTPEARARQMSVETNVVTLDYLDETWTFLDAPGSVELTAEAQSALTVADAAIVVCEPLAEKAAMLTPLLRFLDDRSIPHLIFINKLDTGGAPLPELLEALRGVSARPLLLRQIPLRDGESVTGYVDLVSERAYQWRPNAASDLAPLPETARDEEQTARRELLEALADYDDALLEQLLEDVVPPKEEVYGQLAKDLAGDLIVPVLLGSAERDHGLRRLWKALRHETPRPDATASRLGIPKDADVAAQVFRSFHAPHVGKLSLARVWRGRVTDGAQLDGNKVAGVYRMFGGQQVKVPEARPGEVVGLGKLDSVSTGDLLTDRGVRRAEHWPEAPEPVFSQALRAANRNDEVKLTAAVAKLVDEDPSLRFAQNPDTGEFVLGGQGDIHLQIARERLKSRFGIEAAFEPPLVPYRETIRRGAAHHARFKKQTGGHGQFADIHIEVKPLPRGEGFRFTDSVVGGAVPRQYVPAVEEGVRDALARGPMGFPVVDVAVTLTGGQYHSVDSSEQAFRTCARQGMTEALAQCDPVLLEPILEVRITAPSDYTAKVQRLITGRRGQILGFEAREGWSGWDEVQAHIPQAEMQDLIVELRSLTQGAGSFTARFHHLVELLGKPAEKVVEGRKALA